MRLNPQDKALLITFTGASFLVLVFFFLGVKPYQDKIPETYFEIPVLAEDIQEPEAEENKEIAQNKRRVSTHQAYNVSELRNESKQLFEEDPVRAAIEAQQLGSVEELDAQNEAIYAERQKARAEAQKKHLEEVKAEIEAREQKRARSKGNRESTVSYDLEGREALVIPNPVYTCDAQGIIVIDIAVSGNGTISKMTYNKKTSTSSNGCLIDQALEYAEQALFNQASSSLQNGTISFNFQG